MRAPPAPPPSRPSGRVHAPSGGPASRKHAQPVHPADAGAERLAMAWQRHGSRVRRGLGRGRGRACLPPCFVRLHPSGRRIPWKAGAMAGAAVGRRGYNRFAFFSLGLFQPPPPAGPLPQCLAGRGGAGRSGRCVAVCARNNGFISTASRAGRGGWLKLRWIQRVMTLWSLFV